MIRRGVVAGVEVDRPLYARALRLRYLHPGGLQCFLFFEVMIVIGALLALAELVPWWGVLALPTAVASMVKINDLVALSPPIRGRLTFGAHAAVRTPAHSAGRAAMHGTVDGRPSAPRGHAARRVAGRRRRPAVGRASVPSGVARAAHGTAMQWPAADGRLPLGPEDGTTLGLAQSLNVLPAAEPVDSPRQRARQSAARRYD